MTLDDEILAVEDVVHFARDAAAEHLERATKELHLGSAKLAHYKDFLDATLVNAQRLLALCRAMTSAPVLAALASTSIVQDLLGSARESLRLMYVAMTLLEERAGSTPQGEVAPRLEPAALRACSFCGKTEAELRLVAGPAANICASCTRLACGVLGVALSEPVES